MLSIGLALTYFNLDGQLVIVISLVALAGVFFLSAFAIRETPVDANEQLGFRELLTYTILPKSMGKFCDFRSRHDPFHYQKPTRTI